VSFVVDEDARHDATGLRLRREAVWYDR